MAACLLRGLVFRTEPCAAQASVKYIRVHLNTRGGGGKRVMGDIDTMIYVYMSLDDRMIVSADYCVPLC